MSSNGADSGRSGEGRGRRVRGGAGGRSGCDGGERFVGCLRGSFFECFSSRRSAGEAHDEVGKPGEEADAADGDHGEVDVNAYEEGRDEGAQKRSGRVGGVHELHAARPVRAVPADEDRIRPHDRALGKADEQECQHQHPGDAGEGGQDIADEITDGKQQRRPVQADPGGQEAAQDP